MREPTLTVATTTGQSYPPLHPCPRGWLLSQPWAVEGGLPHAATIAITAARLILYLNFKLKIPVYPLVRQGMGEGG